MDRSRHAFAGLAAAWLLLLAWPGIPRHAHAYDFLVEAETLGQGYQLRGFSGGDTVLLNRRRIVQSLRLELWNVLPEQRSRPGRSFQLSFVTSMRFATDLGDYTTGKINLDPVESWIPEIGNNQIDLLYAYLAGRDLLGLIDFRLGRQVQYDSLDFCAFDGGWLSLRTPFYFSLEVAGGLKVLGETTLGWSTFESDGIGLGSLRAPAPMVAAAIGTSGLRIVSARLSYRRSWARAGSAAPAGQASSTAPSDGDDSFADSQASSLATEEERLAFLARARLLGGRLLLVGGARRNLLVADWDLAHAGLTLRLDGHVVSVEASRDRPSFGGDSIFNVFASEPRDDLRASYELVPVAAWPLRLLGRGYLRRYLSEGTDSGGGGGSQLCGGGTLAARLGLRRGQVRLDASYEDGRGGRRGGVDASGRYELLPATLLVEGRMSLVGFADDQTEGRSGSSFGVQAGLEYRLAEGVSILVAAEENVNRFYRSQLRLWALLSLSSWL